MRKKSPKKKSVARVKRSAKSSKKLTLQAKPASKKVAVPTPAAPPPAPLVTRAPVRKIIGAGNSISIVPKQEKQPEPAPIAAPIVVAEKINKVVPLVPEQRFSWNELPQYLPPQTKFMVNLAQRECESASAWPFPFAKFLSTLPQELCGLEFALLLLGLEHENTKIARLCELSIERIDSLLNRAYSNIGEKFAATCAEMYRKLGTQLGGVGVKVELLIKPYLIAKVDLNFQIMLGAIILRALKRENSIFEGQPSFA